MDQTPRLQAGRFPHTPGSAPRSRRTPSSATSSSATPYNVTPSGSTSLMTSRSSSRTQPSPSSPSQLVSRLPQAPEPPKNPRLTLDPVIPLTVLDGPTQRIYAVSAYFLLLSWRFIDWMRLGDDLDSSFLLFIKWIVIDLIFLFGLPELRIPWLELSQSAVLVIFSVQALFTYLLMFNIALPFSAIFLVLLRGVWDRELAVSEHHVKLNSILQNQSLIMGKQIINILPEGSAMMNPDGLPFCLGDKGRSVALIPLHFNASVPVEIDLVRTDLDSNEEEIVRLTKSEMKAIAARIKEQASDSTAIVATWDYPAKKAGVYRLGKVLDEYKLEVQQRTRDTYVVPCPRARIRKTGSSNRCVRDLSDLALDVVGTPPLKIVYSRTINGKDHSFHFQSLQPDGHTSAFPGSTAAPAGANAAASEGADAGDSSWARPAHVTVPLNESMAIVGDWRYAVDEVHDALGNVVKYTSDSDAESRSRLLAHSFSVKDRPKVRLVDCDLKQPLKVAKGAQARLPVVVELGQAAVARAAGDSTAYSLAWDFAPLASLTDGGDSGSEVLSRVHSARNADDRPVISEPGLYTLKSISSGGCDGDVREPSSCLLINPLRPSLSFTTEDIPDKCAGNSVGLRVDLNLVGTPPFLVRYDLVSDDNMGPERMRVQVHGLRQQIELRPKQSGRYKYIFKQIDDAIYKAVPLIGPDMVLEQDVKPAASAHIRYPHPVRKACLDEQVVVDVLLQGDPPFALEWELVHDGKRTTDRVADIPHEAFQIRTPALAKGGDYILSLATVQDRSGCRTFLQDELKISVTRQRPRAGFATTAAAAAAAADPAARRLTAVQGSDFRMPLRLQGEPPWTVTYRNLDEPDTVLTRTASTANDHILSRRRGDWELLSVCDALCPGAVDPAAARFQTRWFPKPELAIVPSDTIAVADDAHHKAEICEGDVDGFEVLLKGTPPYHVQYEIRHKPFQGSPSLSRKDFDAALSKAAISVDSSHPGDYTYKFSALADNLYNSGKDGVAVALRQRVNAKPSASFAKPGQVFKYCMLEQEHEDRIPIVLTGVAPFSLEIEIKHHSGTQPDLYRIAALDNSPATTTIQIPREHLRLGSQHVRIRQVRDARGCQQRYDLAGGPAVQLHLFDAPAIHPLESRADYCVGERIAYTLSGTPPFAVTYDFAGTARTARVPTTDFRRVADSPGLLTITHLSDKTAQCRAPVHITTTIHPLPSVRISHGRAARVAIHEGAQVDILFEFGGTPPFEFTYTRSTNDRKGHRPTVLETRHDVSLAHTKLVRASQEGTYEVVAVKDKFCAFATHNAAAHDHRQSPH